MLAVGTPHVVCLHAVVPSASAVAEEPAALAFELLHRDLKPSNLLLNTVSDVNIVGFSAGKVLRRRLNPWTSYVGTTIHMSSEWFDPEASRRRPSGPRPWPSC